MQEYYGLKWIFKERSDTVNYMEMTISIRKDRIVTSLFKKLMNLYLYILPHYAHPLGVLAGHLSGNILLIHSFWSDKEDIKLLMEEFYVRLLVWGYPRDLLIPAYPRGITGARAFIKRGSIWQCTSDQDKYTKGRVFFHLTYNPRDQTSKDFQRQWHQHLLNTPWESLLWMIKNKQKIPISINLMCVTYSRPKNIGNIFTYHRDDCLDGTPVSYYMD